MRESLEERVLERTAQLQIANEEIRRLSLRDELTGLNNRAGFYLLAEQELRGARRDGTRRALLFIDVDGLKRVNDELGHQMGDRLIADAARAIATTVRESDLAGRLGGDEFCVLARDPEHCDTLRARLERSAERINAASRPYALSLSIGTALSSLEPEPLSDLLERTDAAMYAEKRRKKACRAG